MDRRIRLLSLVLVGCFGLLFLQLNNWQIVKASSLQNSSLEPRSGASEWTEPRGDIVSVDGVILAQSSPTNDSYGELRSYPHGPLFASITGYFDTVNRAAPYGIEAEYDNYLVVHQSSSQSLQDILTAHTGTDTVALTISASLQQAAATALGGEVGAVVAIDPLNGDVLAMYSNPTYNPNLLASHDPTKVDSYFKSLDPNSGNSPLINGATQYLAAPGSTFKIVTTSAMYDQRPDLTTETLPELTQLKLPQTDLVLHNFAGEKCGGTLPNILAHSCDTAFAKIGLQLGGPVLAEEADAFGFNHRIPLDLPAGQVSIANFPSGSSFAQNQPGLAYSAIGQESVTESALQDALVAAAIADGGTMMVPHLLSRVIDENGNVVDSFSPRPWRQATSQSTAGQVIGLMRGVVEFGTAAGVGFSPSWSVAAKTGTAEVGGNNCSTNWMIATAPAGGGNIPSVALAAVVPYAPGQPCDGQGATVAGPVIKSFLNAYFSQKQG